MALTIAQVAQPNSATTEFPLGPWKARVIDVTFDNSYLTTGEVLLASDLGWNFLAGAVTLSQPSNTGASGTLASMVIARPNSTGSQLTLQLYETAGTVDNPFKEVTSTQDMSAYTVRLIVLGN